jgi:hypothetical protein
MGRQSQTQREHRKNKKTFHDFVPLIRQLVPVEGKDRNSRTTDER